MEVLKKWSEKRADRGSRTKCIARCDCGDEIECLLDNIKSGNTTKCKKCSDISRARKHTTHGLSKLDKDTGAKVYYTWKAMKSRCMNKSDPRYKSYGGRGIKISRSWLVSFAAFMKDMGLPPSGMHSIDRIDNDGNYCKSNCRWATTKDQANNKSNNRIIEVNGELKTLQQWADFSGVKRETIARRLNAGWPSENAIQQYPKPIKTDSGLFGSLKEAAEFHNMSTSGVHGRIKSEKHPEWRKLF